MHTASPGRLWPKRDGIVCPSAKASASVPGPAPMQTWATYDHDWHYQQRRGYGREEQDAVDVEVSKKPRFGRAAPYSRSERFIRAAWHHAWGGRAHAASAQWCGTGPLSRAVPWAACACMQLARGVVCVCMCVRACVRVCGGRAERDDGRSHVWDQSRCSGAHQVCRTQSLRTTQISFGSDKAKLERNAEAGDRPIVAAWRATLVACTQVDTPKVTMARFA